MPFLPLPQVGAPFVDPKTGVLTEIGRRIILSLSGTFQAPAVAFAALPSPAVLGMLRVCSDSNTVVWGATIAAGGANVVLAFYNGSAWTVAGA